jgi:hypothetical protein
MNLQRKKWSILSATLLMAGTVAFAQDPSSTSADPKPKTEVGQRKENQQDRIAQGVQSGQLTAGETSKLESKEAAINGETRGIARRMAKLTAAEKRRSTNNRIRSRNRFIRTNTTPTPRTGSNEVGQRRENQQERIAQGIKSGQLTAGEAAKLENQQKGINQQVAADRAANGGKLTAGEKAQVNKEQNKASKNIYNKKHNAHTQGGVKK